MTAVAFNYSLRSPTRRRDVGWGCQVGQLRRSPCSSPVEFMYVIMIMADDSDTWTAKARLF
jgi:hypothetical protein